jgi:hypothetical protein
MELITSILAGLFSVVSASGFVVDRAIANAVRSQFTEVKELKVRVDNAPSYQILQGKVNKIRLAGRGLEYRNELNIDKCELETDAIDLDRKYLRKTNLNHLRKSLRKPFNTGLHLVIKEEDLNQGLQSPKIKSQLEKLLSRTIAGSETEESSPYQVKNLTLDFLNKNRLSIQLQLSRPQPEIDSEKQFQQQFDQLLDVRLEFGLHLAAGRRIQIIDPTGTVNGKAISSKLLNGFARGFSDRVDLDNFKQQGLLVRLLQLKINDRVLDLAAFTRLEPFTPASPLPNE